MSFNKYTQLCASHNLRKKSGFSIFHDFFHMWFCILILMPRDFMLIFGAPPLKSSLLSIFSTQ